MDVLVKSGLYASRYCRCIYLKTWIIDMTRKMMILDLYLNPKSLNSSTIYADVSLHDGHYQTGQKLRVSSSDKSNECHGVRFMVDDVHNDRLFIKLKVVSPGGFFRKKKVVGERYMSVKKLFDYYQGNIPWSSAVEDYKEPPPYELILNRFSDPPQPARRFKKTNAYWAVQQQNTRPIANFAQNYC